MFNQRDVNKVGLFSKKPIYVINPKDIDTNRNSMPINVYPGASVREFRTRNRWNGECIVR